MKQLLYLGYLLKTASKSNYVIVSNDGGFDAVVRFWQERGMSVSRTKVYHVLPDACTVSLVKVRTDSAFCVPSVSGDGAAEEAAAGVFSGTAVPAFAVCVPGDFCGRRRRFGCRKH